MTTQNQFSDPELKSTCMTVQVVLCECHMYGAYASEHERHVQWSLVQLTSDVPRGVKSAPPLRRPPPPPCKRVSLGNYSDSCKSQQLQWWICI